MAALNHCDELQRQYGHKSEQDLNDIQSQRKVPTTCEQVPPKPHSDILKKFTNEGQKVSGYDQEN